MSLVTAVFVGDLLDESRHVTCHCCVCWLLVGREQTCHLSLLCLLVTCWMRADMSLVTAVFVGDLLDESRHVTCHCCVCW